MARRRSRVLEYFEQQQAEREDAEAAAAEEEANGSEEKPQGGGEGDPFQGFDSAFGLDFFDSKGNE